MLPLGSCATEYFPAWRMIGWDLETGDLVRTLQSRSHFLTPSCQVSNRSSGWSQFCWAAGVSGRLPRRTPSRVDGTATTLRPVLASWCSIPPPHSATSIHAPPEVPRLVCLRTSGPRSDIEQASLTRDCTRRASIECRRFLQGIR